MWRSVKSVSIRSAALHIACAALIALISTASGAFAQCVTTYNFGGISNFGNAVPQASPLIAIINTVNTAFLTNTTSFVSAPGGAQAWSDEWRRLDSCHCWDGRHPVRRHE